MRKRKLFELVFLASVAACNTDKKADPINNAFIKQDKLSGKITEINKILNINNNMKGYHNNIEKETIKNIDFRKVLYTTKNMQLVLMSLKPHEEIGAETHKGIDQFFKIESGYGSCIINDIEQKIESGDVVIVPAGAKHNIINTNKNFDLKIYTIYTPPNHEDGIVRATKNDAEQQPEKFEGRTTEQ
jgi:mannose-6-phosphate isomerase-like protein (cupin superfamily)